MAEVERRCAIYDISENLTSPADADAVNGQVLTGAEKEQRKELLGTVREEGYDQVVERAAYTWFNRIMAIRFMEVNDLLPSRTRMLSANDGSFKPQVLAEALSVDIEGLDRARAAELVQGGDDEATFRYLFLAQCAELADCMPDVFEKVGAAMELLLPDGLLREGGVVNRIVVDIPESDWREGVQIVGWMYQYYVSEKKDEYFTSKRKASAEDIPCATQLFTPEWIVRYLTENSLGRLWMLNNPQSGLASEMDYYLVPEGDAGEFLKIEDPEEITVLDPACGSGHILVYAFDLLAAMYEERGYARRDIPQLVLEKNLTGIEIDPRAAAMASFALTMKACEYDGRFLRRGVRPCITVLGKMELDEEQRRVIADMRHKQERFDAPFLLDQAELLEVLTHLDEVGSLFEPTSEDMGLLRATAASLEDGAGIFGFEAKEQISRVLAELEPLVAKYDVVIANPPYMGSGNMNQWLSGWVKEHYPDEKNDLFSAFFKRNIKFAVPDGELGFMSPFVWMFISSYEKLRRELIGKRTITSLVQLEYSGFADATVPICAFTLYNSHKDSFRGAYIRLSDFRGSENQAPRALEAIQNPDCGWFYHTDAESFKSIPGWPIAYWLSNTMRAAYHHGKTLEDVAHPKVGMQTSNNNKYLRLWWEIQYGEFNGSSKQLIWIKYLKGGSYRKWYGNLEYLLHYKQTPEYILEQKNARVLDCSFLAMHKCTWSDITSGEPSFRYAPDDTFYDISGHCFFPSEKNQMFLLGYVNTSLVALLKKAFNSTFHFQVGDLQKIILPDVDDQTFDVVTAKAKKNVGICKTDWDAFETSWDFERHPLVCGSLISGAFDVWVDICQERFSKIKANEEELNRIFAGICHMENEVPIEVPDDKVSVRRADLVRDVKSLISYAIGCIMGRYSLDKPGLVLANQGDGLDEYLEQVPNPTFKPDEDGIIPLTEIEYFHDDAIGLFVDFLCAAYGDEDLEENLKFVADALGGDGTPRQIIRTYFRNDFFADHCKTYSVPSSGKRPIYWLFDSGKKGGFRALFYMHRYTPDLLARLRTEYVHPQQERYRTQLERIDDSIQTADKREQAMLRKEHKKISEQLAETNVYEEKVHHLADQMITIDLDDGVNHNYALFQDVLAKIK